MIPVHAIENGLGVGFGLLANRKGAHWALTEVDTGAGVVSEAHLLAEAIAGVLKYVPIPDKEIGIVGDLGTLGVALYLVVYRRMEIDAQIARGEIALPQGAPATRAPAPRPPGPVGVPTMPPQAEPVFSGQGVTAVAEGDLASVLEGMGDTPLVARAQGHVTGELPVQPGPRNEDQVLDDAERLLFERTQPEGTQSAQVDELVAALKATPEHTVLDTLGGIPEFGGAAVEGA